MKLSILHSLDISPGAYFRKGALAGGLVRYTGGGLIFQTIQYCNACGSNAMG